MRERESGWRTDLRVRPYDLTQCETAGSQVATLQVSKRENANPSGQAV